MARSVKCCPLEHEELALISQNPCEEILVWWHTPETPVLGGGDGASLWLTDQLAWPTR